MLLRARLKALLRIKIGGHFCGFFSVAGEGGEAALVLPSQIEVQGLKKTVFYIFM